MDSKEFDEIVGKLALMSTDQRLHIASRAVFQVDAVVIFTGMTRTETDDKRNSWYDLPPLTDQEWEEYKEKMEENIDWLCDQFNTNIAETLDDIATLLDERHWDRSIVENYIEDNHYKREITDEEFKEWCEYAEDKSWRYMEQVEQGIFEFFNLVDCDEK